MKFACFDIETIPNQSLPKGVKPEFDPDTVKLGNTIDPFKVQAKIENAKKEFDEALDKKMSLDPDLCEVVCFVGYENDNFYIGAVNGAWNFIRDTYLNHVALVSYNGIAFDLPVLLHQAMLLNIPVSPQMYADLTKRYDNRYHYDLCELLSTWDFGKKRTKSLNFYLKHFGIGEKKGGSSDVYNWWKLGDYDKIRQHCETDVKLTAMLFDRLKDWIVREDYKEI